MKTQYRLQIQVLINIPCVRYTQSELKAKYPYLNVEDIVLGSDCGEDEGWFDPWLLLSAYKNKIRSLGVEIIPGRVTAFKSDKTLLVSSLLLTTIC